MMQRLLAPVLVLLAVFAAAYVVTWATESSTSVAVVVTVVSGILWIVAHDVRRTPWASESQRSHDAVYAAAAFAALHAPGQASTDCSPGFDGGFGGCGDVGA
jgi:hypothetical protein